MQSPMLFSSRVVCRVLRSRANKFQFRSQRRQLLTLAIETSCDDTSVAIVEKHGSESPSKSPASVHFLESITADSREYKGIHPIVALGSHQENLASLVQKSLHSLPLSAKDDRIEDSLCLSAVVEGKPAVFRRRKPDFISVTRGPGMLSSLTTGIDTAKGLAVAWQIPLVGVHHMQAHLLTPRLVAALRTQAESALRQDERIEFPFLSLLVSGGHTLLVLSKSIVDHEILGSTIDIAVGDALDKFARDVLPDKVIEESKSTMYGKALEAFVFPNGKEDYAEYKPPATRGEEIEKYEDERWGWKLTMPFCETKTVGFSFVGILSTVHNQVENRKLEWEKAGDSFPLEARIALGRHFMRVCFEHLASRTVIALQNLQQSPETLKWSKKMRQKNKHRFQNLKSPVQTLVISGGVAANQYLRHVFRSFLDARGFSDVKVVAPPMYLCTDNAAMIGWTGIEMFQDGWRADLNFRAVRKWSLDTHADDGGIPGSNDWVSAQPKD